MLSGYYDSATTAASVVMSTNSLISATFEELTRLDYLTNLFDKLTGFCSLLIRPFLCVFHKTLNAYEISIPSAWACCPVYR